MPYKQISGDKILAFNNNRMSPVKVLSVSFIIRESNEHHGNSPTDQESHALYLTVTNLILIELMIYLEKLAEHGCDVLFVLRGQQLGGGGWLNNAFSFCFPLLHFCTTNKKPEFRSEL